ncbi:ankyrin repeat domain-containing protein 50-like [Ruditapes philippinarum]|uniref:ankyrin repeat domain-containing protein 50-like n=1 Tax=Ruditapes philippinarum TaxID=129788 RepID=UPI00295B07FE|nr:ankyrin repeat domain-containing protein 50-like [Ruditapes philippinarum]XP_060600310.1 ankyrin repeat domain-containing protein 50-like [Ruditapes philippinarum]
MSEQSCLDNRVLTCVTMEYFEDDLFDCIVSNKSCTILEYLKKGLDVNHAFRSTERPERLGKTLLEISVFYGVTDVIKLLIKRKCDVNLTYIVNIKDFSYQLEEFKRDGRLKLTCMFRCIVQSEVDIIKLLVTGGFDVNVFDERGCSSIWHAADLNNYDMLKAMLLSKEADVNKADNTYLTPLHISAMKGNVKMTSLLIQRGAHVDKVQLRGSTPLILACRAADFDTVRILLLNGADPNHIGYNGHNVISTALQSTTDIRIPEMLMSCGALVDLELINLCRKEGKKFLLLKEHPELFELLKENAYAPRTMKTFCCLKIRRLLVQSRTKMHLIKKVEILPLPRLIKDYLLFGHV